MTAGNWGGGDSGKFQLLMSKSQKLIEHARELRRVPTKAEALLWKRLQGRREDGLKFRRQEPIGPYIADFVCFEAKLVIEVDGSDHLFRIREDSVRSAWLEGEGFSVLRFKNEDVLFDPRACWLSVLSSAYSRVPRLVEKLNELPTF